MYENDYSWVPSFFWGLSALAALGGFAIAFISVDLTRSRAIKAWLLIPIFLSIGLGVIAAIFGENLESLSLILFVPIFAIIISPPWLLSALPAYVAMRAIRAKVGRRGIGD